MIEIQLGSDAYERLWITMDTPGTYLIRIDVRADGIAIKRNEGTWSPTLACEARPAAPPRQPRSVVTQADGDIVELQFGDERFR